LQSFSDSLTLSQPNRLFSYLAAAYPHTDTPLRGVQGFALAGVVSMGVDRLFSFKLKTAAGAFLLIGDISLSVNLTKTITFVIINVGNDNVYKKAP